MLRKTAIISIFAIALWACGDEHNHADADHHQHDGTEQHDAQSGEMTFGEKITPDGAITLEDMMAELEGKDSIQTKVTGMVESVCKKKGCWMNLTDGNNKVFVRFKDYGFFMPLDCEGQRLVMRGTAKIEETSVEELRHYAEDEGQSADEIAAITEPKKELTFLADGVVFVK